MSRLSIITRRVSFVSLQMKRHVTFLLKLCRMLHIRTLEASAEVLSFKGHQGSAFAPVSQHLENIQDFLRESKTSPYVFTGKVVRDSVYPQKKEASKTFQEEKITTFHRMSQGNPSVLRNHSNDCQFLPFCGIGRRTSS